MVVEGVVVVVVEGVVEGAGGGLSCRGGAGGFLFALCRSLGVCRCRCRCCCCRCCRCLGCLCGCGCLLLGRWGRQQASHGEQYISKGGGAKQDPSSSPALGSPSGWGGKCGEGRAAAAGGGGGGGGGGESGGRVRLCLLAAALPLLFLLKALAPLPPCQALPSSVHHGLSLPQKSARCWGPPRATGAHCRKRPCKRCAHCKGKVTPPLTAAAATAGFKRCPQLSNAAGGAGQGKGCSLSKGQDCPIQGARRGQLPVRQRPGSSGGGGEENGGVKQGRQAAPTPRKGTQRAPAHCPTITTTAPIPHIMIIRCILHVVTPIVQCRCPSKPAGGAGGQP